jgi:RNA polymerase sigma factor (TIGR02999 family)
MSLDLRFADYATFCLHDAPFSHKSAFWFRLGERPGCPGAGISNEGLVGTMTGRNAENPGEIESPPENAPSTSGERGKAPSDVTEALEEMMPLVYEELRRLAGGYLSKERPEHTLQRTALVHEAYLRLVGQDHVSWENPANLLAIFARLMRQTLINHAVARTRAKRGGTNPTEVMLEFYERHEIDVTTVDEALRELEALDSRQAQIVELRFFGGLTIEEIGALLEISPATVKREWSVAKLWLRKALAQPS